MAAGDVYKVTIQATGQGSTYMNVLAAQQIGAVDLAVTDFQAFADGWKDIWRPSQSNSVTWRSWRAVQVFGPNVDYTQTQCERVGGRAFEANLSGSLVGSDAGEALPPQCALVVTHASGLIGRRHRGRAYVFGFTEAVQAAGVFTPAVITTMTTAYTTWFNKYKDSGTDPKIKFGVWSERTAFGCEWRGDPPQHVVIEGPNPDQAFTPVTGFNIRPNVNTQRRRALGVGR